jgi:4-carboxymuconolactone decarboxylase
MEPDSPLLSLPEGQVDEDDFAAELDYMILENVYFDAWAREDVLNKRDRSVVTLAFLMGIGNEKELAEHVPVALRNGLTVAELAQFVHQAGAYLGFPAAKAVRTTFKTALKTAGAIK